jgi:cation:H+ antiporter
MLSAGGRGAGRTAMGQSPAVVWGQLVAALLVILAGATCFTNGVEWVGEGLGLSEGAVGSVLAAVGTALPETILPFVAILTGHPAGKDIGVGSILGGPFMLSTVAMFMLGASVLGFSRSGRRGPELNARRMVVGHDLGYFSVAFAPAIVAGLLHVKAVSVVLAVGLIVGYAAYVRRHFRAPDEPALEAEAVGEVQPLYFRAWLRRMAGRPVKSAPNPPVWASALQTLVSLGLIVAGARLFVSAIATIADRLDVPALPFALIVAPIATELPEVSNSVLWIRRTKDTLAMGNVTGAMVFQATFPVSIGLAFTPWRLSGAALASALISLSAALTVWGALRRRGRLSPVALLLFGAPFVVYTAVVIATL